MSKSDSPSPFAVFSAIFGVLSIPCFTCPVPAPLAIVFGHIALGHFGRPADAGTNKAPAWVGLALGYTSLIVFVVLLVIGILFGEPDTSEPVEAEVPIQETPGQGEQPSPRPVEPAPPLPAAATGAPQDDDVYLVEGDGRYHTFFCRAINDTQAQRTRFADASQSGFRACDICQPEAR